jgi:hypothetical protein
VGEGMLGDGKFGPISHVVGKGAGLFKVVDGGAEAVASLLGLAVPLAKS